MKKTTVDLFIGPPAAGSNLRSVSGDVAGTFYGLEFVVHRAQIYTGKKWVTCPDRWDVTERSCGARLTSGSTRASALLAMEASLHSFTEEYLRAAVSRVQVTRAIAVLEA